jgi:mannose-6-phosphate isomerase-like protein (cupin superfamily)
VVHPGTYGVQEGERLSAVLLRAGGLRSDAYPYGAILGRSQIEQLEEQQRAELIRRLQEQGSALRLLPENDDEQRSAKEASLAQWKVSLEKLENTPSQGRQVIHIGGDIHRWANTSADVQVRAGDSIFIPKTPNFVVVNGAVYNPTAVTHKPGKSAEWYLNQAGGPDTTANKNGIFVVRADGSVVGRSGNLFSGGAKDVELRPGDMVVVPEKAYSGTTRWKNTLQAAQLVSAIGIAIQVARGF